MEHKLLASIYRKLIKSEWEELPYGLKGGKIGLLIFMALYYELTGNGKARNLAGSILHNVRKERRAHHCTFMDGSLGLAWALYLLSQKGVMEHDASLENLQGSIFLDFMHNHYHSPLLLTIEDNLFSAGIYTLKQLPDGESFERYSVEERLISMIDECERQLTESFQGLHSPERLSLPAINSYLYFLGTCVKKRIFPYKAGLLLNHVHELYGRLKEQNVCDDFVYHYLNDNGTAHLPQVKSCRQSIEITGNIGFYSLLYDLPGLFLEALRQIYDTQQEFRLSVKKIVTKENITIETLCGLGYGLLLNADKDCLL